MQRPQNENFFWLGFPPFHGIFFGLMVRQCQPFSLQIEYWNIKQAVYENKELFIG